MECCPLFDNPKWLSLQLYCADQWAPFPASVAPHHCWSYWFIYIHVAIMVIMNHAVYIIDSSICFVCITSCHHNSPLALFYYKTHIYPQLLNTGLNSFWYHLVAWMKKCCNEIIACCAILNSVILQMLATFIVRSNICTCQLFLHIHIIITVYRILY